MSRSVQVLHNQNLNFSPLIFFLFHYGEMGLAAISHRKDCSAYDIQYLVQTPKTLKKKIKTQDHKTTEKPYQS